MCLFRHSLRLFSLISVFTFFGLQSIAVGGDFAVIPSDDAIKPKAEVPVEIHEHKFCPKAAVIPPALPTPAQEEGEENTPESIPVLNKSS